MTAVNTPPPQQNQEDRNNRQTNWVLQLIFHLIFARLLYSVFVNTKKNVNVSSPGSLPQFENSYETGDRFDIFAVVTSDVRIDFENMEKKGQVVYSKEDCEYTHKFNRQYEETKVKIKPSRRFYEDINEKLYLTVFVIPQKSYIIKTKPFYKSKFKEEGKAHQLVKMIPLTKIKKEEKHTTVRLIQGKSEDKEKELEKKEEYETEERKYWIPRVDINLVYDNKKHTATNADLHFEAFTKHYEKKMYDPLLFLSQFWVLEEHLVPIKTKNKIYKPKKEHYSPELLMKTVNEAKDLFLNDLVTDPLIPSAVDLREEEDYENENYKDILLEQLIENNTEEEEEERELELKLNYSTCHLLYYLVLTSINTSNANNVWGIDNAKEIDSIKKTLMNTNVYFLIFSAMFILLHTVFSIFALRSDIQFWLNNKSMEGLSTLTLGVNFISEIIIALYVYDNEKRSFVILFDILLSLGSSFWKLTKAVKVKFVRKYPFFLIENKCTYIENKTKEYDRVAIKYMSILLAPCIMGYAVYSLYYHEHKSWYSYIISVLAGSVYTFGFIMMTPQLYINYKLKSVEHLPWKALIYRSLNTFVDDVASFLIDMPMLHRLSCFRDDIIFFCYLYQRWKYKVDPNRSVMERNKESKKVEELEGKERSKEVNKEQDDGKEKKE